jgi:hypothetical protein
MNENIYWKDPLGIFLNCIIEDDTVGIIDEFQKGICGGHHALRATSYKISRTTYYWPKIFSKENEKARACMECQFFAGKQKLPSLPLVPIKVDAHFQQWGLYFIGETHPTPIAQHKWILTATDYFSKLVEAIPTIFATDAVVIKFIEDNILARFGFPRKIITNNAQSSKSLAMIDLC